jgi:hypothetical protein
MAFIGNTPISVAFLTDTFSGNGSTTAFTMTVAPANTSSIIVAITGVLQDPSTYSVSGTTLTFSAAPPTGTSNISVRYLGIPASGVTTTAYRTVTDFTATAGQTSFSVPSYTIGYIDVYRNGVRLVSTDYTATTGTTVVLNNACTVGDAVVTESFYVSSVLNAIPATAGSVSDSYIVGMSASKLTGTQTIPKTTLPTGSVLQVVSTAKTDTFVTSATVTDTAVTGLTVSITPTSSSSKILVFCNLGIAAENAQGGATKLTRTVSAVTTQLSLADTAGSRSRGSFAGSAYRGSAAGYLLMVLNQNLSYLDSPATTSAITYGVQVSSLSTGTYINRSGTDTDAADTYRGVSYITVMEIAA